MVDLNHEKITKKSVKTYQKIHLFYLAKWNHISVNLRFSPKIGRGISPPKNPGSATAKLRVKFQFRSLSTKSKTVAVNKMVQYKVGP